MYTVNSGFTLSNLFMCHRAARKHDKDHELWKVGRDDGDQKKKKHSREIMGSHEMTLHMATIVFTPDSQHGQHPLLPTYTQELPGVCHGQAPDLQLTHSSILPQADSVPSCEGLGPLPPLHGAALFSSQPSGYGALYGLFPPQTLCEFGRQGREGQQSTSDYLGTLSLGHKYP